MKRKSLLFLLLLALFAPWAANAQTQIVSIGDGTSTSSTTPYNSLWGYSFVEQIYTADEIGTAGTITAISFNMSSTSAQTNNVDVFMLNVSRATFSSTSDYEPVTASDIVFSGSVTFNSGWTTITLDTPFEYNGTDNLLIGMHEYTSGYNTRYFYYTSASNTVVGFYSDSANPDPTNLSSYSGNKATSANRANIQIEITPGEGPCCPKPKVTVDEVTSNSVTFHWDGTGECQYSVYNATTNEQVFGESGIINPKTITGLTPLTDYRLEVRAYCPDCEEHYSDVVTKTFRTTAVAIEVGDAWADDFEGNNCGWELINGTCTNAWAWGAAANNGGSHGLYVSNDNGTSNAYTIASAPSVVYATKLLNFTEGKFEFSYDWKAKGESNYDYLRVWLAPASATFTAGQLPNGSTSMSGYTNTTPSGWIALGGKLNLADTWENVDLAVNVATGTYYMVFMWGNDGGGGSQPPAAVDNVSISRIACSYDVEGLAASNITTNSATLKWNHGEATQWQVTYADNSTFQNAVEEIVSDTTYNMINLSPATTYYARVRAYCGGEDFGSWCATIDFLTECVALSSYPYTENFDSYTTSSGFLPVCWSRINTGSSYSIYPYIYNSSSASYSHTNCLYFYSYGNSSTTTLSDQYAILPEMENLAGKQITLFARGYNNNSTFKIGTMTDPADVTTFTEIATQELTTSYQEHIYLVPANTTANYIAIMMERPNETSSVYRGVYIDDITIDFAPSCPKPTDLAVTANSQTAHGATITWTENGEANNWLITLSTESDFSNVTWLPVEGEPTYTFTGLNPETTYYVKVQASCGEDDLSEYSNVVSFTTTIACPAPTGFAAAEIYGYSAKLNWTGYSESYTVSYRTAAYTDGIGEGFGTSLPSGWENKTGLLSDIMDGGAWGTATQWLFGTSNGVFDAHARINIYGSNSTERHGWLITPEFTVSQGASTLTFDLALTAYSGSAVPAPATDGTDDKFVVLISTDNEATWTILREWNNEEGATYVYNNIANTATGEQVSLDLSSYVGQSVRIAFYGESTVSNADNNLHIDNVHCGIDYAAGQWETVTVSDTTMVVLTTLTPETAYEAKVQGDCGEDGLSEETSILSFTTIDACPVPTGLTVVDSLLTANTAYLKWNGSPDVDAFTVRYRVPEHVENGISETFGTSIPTGWENKRGRLEYVMNDSIELSSGTQWTFGSNNGVFDNHARINIYGSGSSERHGWLITPAFTLASSTFTFDLALTAYSGSAVPAPETDGTDDKFVVLISTDNEATWTILRQWDNAEGSTYVYNNIANTATGEQVSIDLSAYVGQKVRIAFYGESTVSNADNNLHIDNVLIGNPTTVPATEWQTAVSETTNVTLTGLNPETTYEAQVKSDCSDPEEWSTAITFTTLEQTTLTQTIALTAGVNWVSTYLEITLDELKAALIEATPGQDITIKGKNNNTKYIARTNRWMGTLTWDVAMMYRITVAEDCELVLEGMPIDPAQHPITIEGNGVVNWIGYPFAESMTPTAAFDGFAVNNDVVKYKTTNSKYVRGRWTNGVTSLDAGKGYLYISAPDAADRTLVFPSVSKATKK